MKNLTLSALCLAVFFAACNHAPLGRKPDAQSSVPSATVTSTQTSTDTDTAIDAPAPVLPPVSSPEDECVKRMGYWDATTNSCRDTQPETAPTTATSTGTATTTAVDASVDDSYKKKAAIPFKILSVKVDKVDALGKPAEDIRSFGIIFNEPAADIELTVMEDREGGNIVHYEYIGGSVESLYVSPGRWNGRLRSDTSYKWVIRANADMTVLNGVGSSDSASGTFKTAYCFIGEWKYHYTPDAATDGIGKCHGAMMQCVDNGLGIGSLSGAGESTPYPWGDICGNGVDDDCDGVVDNAPTIEIPAGQDTLWSKSGTDGEVLRFNVKTSAAAKTRISTIKVDIESKGVNLGYFHLWKAVAGGKWEEILPVKFYDATSGAYAQNMADLGKEFYSNTSSKYTLGIVLPEYGMFTEENGQIGFMLVALPDIQSKLSGTSVRVSNPRTETSCPASGGKTITIE